MDLLRSGYAVRAAVRSEEKQSIILNAPSIQALDPGHRLSFVIIPDITANGAYDGAVNNVKYVIHVASPQLSTEDIPQDQLDAEVTKPALKGTMNMLLAAQQSPTIQRLVITSSIFGLCPYDLLTSVFSDTVFTEKTRAPDPSPDNPPANAYEAYCQSKVLALNTAERWLGKHKPHFDVIHVAPAITIGAHELFKTPEDYFGSSNLAALVPIAGGTWPYPTCGSTVHLDDVSRVHVASLSPDIAGNQSFLVAGNGINGTRLDDGKDFAKQHFPDEVMGGFLPCAGSLPTHPAKIDASKTEEVFGFQHQNFESMVRDLIPAYLAVAKQTGSIG